MPIRRDAVCTAFLRVFQDSLYPKLSVTAFNADLRPMGQTHSKNGTISEEDQNTAKRVKVTTVASSDVNLHQGLNEIVLSTLEQAANLPHAHELQKAADLATSLLKMINDTKSGSKPESGFTSLVVEACNFLYAMMNEWKDGKVLLPGLILKLLHTLEEMNEFAVERASRGALSRFLHRMSDAVKTKKYGGQLKDSLAMFGLHSCITIEEAVSRIQDQSDAILAALKVQTSSSDRIIPSSPTPFAHANPSTLPAPFANIVNNGKGTLNSIHGNYVVNNTTTNASSTNSGDIMNISTINANNKYDPGHGMGRRNGIMDVKSVPRRPSTGGRGRKAGYTSGQRGRSGLKTT